MTNHWFIFMILKPKDKVNNGLDPIRLNPKNANQSKVPKKLWFLFSSTTRALSIFMRHPKITGKYYGEVIEKKVLPKLHNKTVGFCIKTMHPRTHQISLKNFSRDWESKLCHTLHIVQIWLNVTSGCSQIWKITSETLNLTIEKS